jgi:hypothetical protein
MRILRKMIFVLAVILITSVIWVGTNVYLSYNSTELRGELLGSENIYDFLGKGMLEEVKITLEEEESVAIEGLTVDLLEPIEPYFSRIAFEKIVEKIETEFIVPPLEFHNLQNDAVMRSFEVEED